MIKNLCLQTKVNQSIFMIAGLFVLFGTVDVQAFTCGSSISRDGKTYSTLIAEDGRCWLDRNLGASRKAISRNDTSHMDGISSGVEVLMDINTQLVLLHQPSAVLIRQDIINILPQHQIGVRRKTIICGKG